MARKRVQIDPTLRDWASVDTALRDIRECCHAAKELEIERDRRIDDVKSDYAAKVLPLNNRIKRLESDIKAFVDAHQAELTGKSRRLNFGTVGYRRSSRLVVPTARIPEIIETLKQMGRREFIKTREDLDKEALKKQPADFILQLGVSIRSTDDFYYDVQDPGPEG